MIQDYFQPHLKPGYEFQIEGATLSRDGVTLYITMETNFLLPFDTLEDIKEQIRAEIPGLKRVAFMLKFKDMVQDREEIVCLALGYLTARMSDNPWVKTMQSDGLTIEGDILTIFVPGEMAAESLNETAARSFSEHLRDDFDCDLTVRFAVSEEAKEQALEAVETEDPEPAAPETGLSPVDSAPASPEKSQVLKGRLISGNPVPMDQLPWGVRGGEGSVITAGRIFKVETRLVNKSAKAKKYSKNDYDKRRLVKILFSDGRDSVAAKFFSELDEWDKLESELHEGAEIIARGKLEYDPFDRAEVLNVNDINRYEMPHRQDTAKEKRIELHAHTKMSAMDGATEPADLVRRAVAWGHEAIAITDHGVVHAFPAAYNAGRGKIKVILGCEGYLYDDEGKHNEDGTIDVYSGYTNHIVILARNKTGLKNLYRLISYSHLNYFYKRPRIPRSILMECREGLILGSACQAGELYQAILAGEPDEALDRIAGFYDYLEIQPVSNNRFMIEDDRYPVTSEEDIRNMNRKVLAIGKRIGRPVVATGDTHYLDPADNVVREIIRAGMGYSDIGKDSGLYFKSTDEMLEEMAYLGEQDCYDLVIGNPAKIAGMIEDIAPTPGKEFPRPTIENADQILRDSCYQFAHDRYGDPLPKEIEDRLETELNSIIGNGYAVMYISAKMLVDKSRRDGYVVGSRGSVGSSVAAFFSGISEVNPLKAHYVCPNCKKVIWGDSRYECGVDMPAMDCPECGTPMDQDGYSIPFETFLGFKGDKEPDIDLNFAGEYQATAQQYVDEIFGAENTFKAGTVGTVQERTAFGFLSAYNEATRTNFSNAERQRLALSCKGIKRTTGQHPGGIIIVPDGHEIFEVTPIQYPANDKDSGIITTHLDYHSFEEALLKLDILGHDGPSIVRLLKESTGIDPETVPYNDPKVLSLFTGTEALDIKDPDYRLKDGTFGVPEFGTPIARGMLNDTKPTTIGELVRLSGLAHGTDVWSGNAQDLIKKGIATMNEVIATRDDIMTYLIDKGLPPQDAFRIMEDVRKGKVAKKQVKGWAATAKEMREHDIPQWYIDSCEKIQYMFPRGHAAAYVIMSCRIAYFKVYYPAHFYAARFTSKVDDFNWDVAKQGSVAVWDRMLELNRQIDEATPDQTTTKWRDERNLLEIVYEMLARGYAFEAPNFEHSEGDRFTVHEGRVVVPFNALQGVGTNAGTAVKNAWRERPFQTVEDLQDRGHANKTVIEGLRAAGVLDGMEESNQISMF